jgi:hypothetical protein
VTDHAWLKKACPSERPVGRLTPTDPPKRKKRGGKKRRRRLKRRNKARREKRHAECFGPCSRMAPQTP